MINDVSMSLVNCTFDEIKIPISNPDIFFQNKGFFINRLNEQYLTYVRDLKIWTTRSFNTMNYYNNNKNLFINSFPINLLGYYKMLEGQGLSIIDSTQTASFKIDNSRNKKYNFIWTSMESCPQGKYLNNTIHLLPNSCLECPSNCKSCSFGLGKIACTVCDEGFYVKNHNCVESTNKGISLMNENTTDILIYNNSNGLTSTWTTIFWVNIYDYNNFDHLQGNNYLIKFKFLSVFLEFNSIMNFKGYSNTVQFNFSLCFDQWTVIAVSWNTGHTGGNIYLNNNYYNNINGAKKIISTNYPLSTIHIGSNVFGVLKRFQLVNTNTTYDEAIKLSFSKL